MSQDSYELKLYPLAVEEFIGTVKVQDTPISEQDTSFLETVIILDRSGSMGDAARRVTNEIIPLFLSKLSYDEKQVIHFITFDSITELYSKQIKELKTLGILAKGNTMMAPAVMKCQELFEKFNYSKPIRLLTISDGEVQDMSQTESAAAAFVEALKKHDFTINSQAVRLFTSARQPDTRALASLLQINNTIATQLTDIATSETNDSVAEKIADLFRSDKLANGKNLTTKYNIVIKFPWESTASAHLTLTPGENLFWLKAAPTNEIKVGEVPVKTVMQEPLTLMKFQSLMTEMLEFIVDHMRVLKVVGTDSAEETVKQMVEYFEKKEDELINKSSFPGVLKKKISKVLALIAKDDNIKTLDPAQKAEYLRQAGFTTDDPTWVEQLFKYGLDIDQITKKEVLMAVVFSFLAMIVFKLFVA